MAKFIVFAAIMVALLAFAQASRFTITTIVDENEDNQYGQSQQRCQQQIQQQFQHMRHCLQYLSSHGGMDMKILVYGKEGQQEHLQLCCRGLQNLDKECRCEAVRQVMRMEVGQGQQMEQMKMKARYLPSQCNIGPQECRV